MPQDEISRFGNEVAEDVAGQASELFPPFSPSLNWLHEQIKAVIRQWAEHDQATAERERDLAAHFRTMDRSVPPCPDLVWDLWPLPAAYFTDDEVTNGGDMVREGWGPARLLDTSAIPPEPIHWLYPFGDSSRRPSAVLPAQCFIVAVVHDVARRGKGFRLLLEGIDLPPSLQVYVDGQSLDTDGFGLTGFDGEGIKRALAAVKDGLKVAMIEMAMEPAQIIDGARTEPLPTPNDLITTPVVVKDYAVSRHTIKRHVDAGELKDYRPKDAPKNAPFLLSRAEVAGKWQRR